jgi:hypothetical protein
MAGGIVRNGYQCGMVWGSTLAAGGEACRRFGRGGEAEAAAISAAKLIVEAFRDRHGTIDCFDLIETDFAHATKADLLKYFVSGKPIACIRMSATYAPMAFEAVQTALGDAPDAPPASPVSCAALLARRLGASDEQAVAVAGFAGGIGLSGGACGALGAAIWFDALSGGGDFKAIEKRAGAVVARFLEASGHRFECSEIAGRTFASVSDHAEYLRGGGCAAILDALAAPQRPT